ncbi:Hypothetical predicted protein [Octopus vulgaris]|uniref:Uncharacterized protein n=1 Tax=Octopus vulgaris TaxID=6645 RepID=A0AA36B2W6_OCTVU|nr:Hypothetical predicted protein [Octopus vulgaris]
MLQVTTHYLSHDKRMNFRHRNRKYQRELKDFRGGEKTEAMEKVRSAKADLLEFFVCSKCRSLRVRLSLPKENED